MSVPPEPVTFRPGLLSTDFLRQTATSDETNGDELTSDEEPEDLLPMDEDDVNPGSGGGGAAGSNPLASVSKIDLIWSHTENEKDRRYDDFSLNGSTMLHERVKLNFELHYAATDLTGNNEQDWQSFHVKPIYFIRDRKIGERWGMRIAAGGEYIRDFNNEDKGIGTGSDVIAPLLGFAFMNREKKLVLIPLVQHFMDLNGSTDINATAFRMIALQPLPNNLWLKGDLKVPRDCENNTWPASAEAEVGTMLASNIGVFGQGLAGLGGDRNYDWGFALGVPVNF